MDNRYFMEEAYKNAAKALKKDESPIGAVIVYKDKIIACGYNKKNKTNDVTNHAEIIAIRKASKKLQNWRLKDCQIYITLEPCPMCASAIRQARINKIYYNESNRNPENIKIVNKILSITDINPKVQIIQTNFFDLKSKKYLNSFYQKKRIKK